MSDVRVTPLPDNGGANTWPQPLDLTALAAIDPASPPMIIDHWLPAGYATLLAGHGGAGKSTIALHLAADIAVGAPFLGLEVGQRRVLFLSCEDREGVLHWRLQRICDHEGIGIADLAGHLDVLDLVGHDSVLFQRDPITGQELTRAYGELAQRIRETGAEVVVIDGVADVFGGNENARAEVKQFVNALVSLIPPERGAVLLVAHVNKMSAATGRTSEGYSGSTGWHNAARARWYLRPETEQGEDGEEPTGELLLELQKSNLGRADQSMRFQWDDERHLFVGKLDAPTSVFDRRARDREECEGIVAALRAVIAAGDYCPTADRGPRTAFRVLSTCTEFPDSLRANSKANRARFWRHVEALRRNRVIAEGSFRRANRQRTPTLVLNASVDACCVDASNTESPNTAQSGAPPPCVDASHSTRGYGGTHTHAPCPKCDGEGCGRCNETGQASEAW